MAVLRAFRLANLGAATLSKWFWVISCNYLPCEMFVFIFLSHSLG